MKTAEFVSPKHPDKICDFIADSILDAYMEKDHNSRVAVEVLGGHKNVHITGEITSKAKVDIIEVVEAIVGKNYKIKLSISKQSPEIAQGVNTGGAGDQGIMVGYACKDTPNFMPLEYELARNLCEKIYQKYPFTGKTQVTVEGKKVKTVVCSFQNAPLKVLGKLVKKIIKAEEYLINPCGDWTCGGFDADSGLSGRKIIVDAYGPSVPAGGGSFSGKDWTKVDRSGAYMARKIAVQLLKKHHAKEVLVKIAYAIGKAEPVMAEVIIDGKKKKITGYDLRPREIRKLLHLDRQKFSKISQWGHFGRGFEWDK